MKSAHKTCRLVPPAGKAWSKPLVFLTPSLENYRVPHYCNSNTSHHTLKRKINTKNLENTMDLLFISFVSEVTYEVLSKTCQVCIKQIT